MASSLKGVEGRGAVIVVLGGFEVAAGRRPERRAVGVRLALAAALCVLLVAPLQGVAGVENQEHGHGEHDGAEAPTEQLHDEFVKCSSETTTSIRIKLNNRHSTANGETG